MVVYRKFCKRTNHVYVAFKLTHFNTSKVIKRRDHVIKWRKDVIFRWKDGDINDNALTATLSFIATDPLSNCFRYHSRRELLISPNHFMEECHVREPQEQRLQTHQLCSLIRNLNSHFRTHQFTSLDVCNYDCKLQHVIYIIRVRHLAASLKILCQFDSSLHQTLLFAINLRLFKCVLRSFDSSIVDNQLAKTM